MLLFFYLFVDVIVVVVPGFKIIVCHSYVLSFDSVWGSLERGIIWG